MADPVILTELAETTPFIEATGQAGKSGVRQRVLLINSGWGSSGYYGPDVLAEAANSGVFASGTHLYINHPTQSEDVERPERDLLDLAAVLTTDAVYDQREKGLVGVVETFPRYREVLAEYKDHIGLSIRASGTVEYGEAEGREGPIVTSLTSAQSIDYVTRAGRGGRIMELLEAARGRPDGEPDTDLLRKATEARLVEAVSDAEWGDVSQSDYDIGQWRSACLVGPSEPSDSKGAYKLPVKMPNGDVNRNGAHAAASRIGQVDASADQKKAAAKKLVSIYRNQLEEDPPAALLAVAGVSESAVSRWAALSEARNVGQWLEARLHRMFTEITDGMFGDGRLTREERISLSSAIGDALQAFTSKVEGQAPQLYQRDLWEEPEAPDTAPAADTTTTGDMAEAGNTADVTTEPGSSPAELKEERGMPELTEDQVKQLAEAADTKTRLEEALTKLEEAAGQIDNLKKRADNADARAAMSDEEKKKLAADKAAGKVVSEALKTSGLPVASHAAVTESACRDLPLTESGDLDTEAFAKVAESAIKTKATEIATLMEDAGVGSIRGLGESRHDVPNDQIDQQLEEAFAGLPGMSSAAAKVAVNGRA